MNKQLRLTCILAAIITSACQAVAAPEPTLVSPSATARSTATATLIPTRSLTQVAATSIAALATEAAWVGTLATPPPGAVPTNVRVNDDTIHQYRRYLLFDSIRPIYRPLFVLASEEPLHDNELVMGVLVNGAARAYPISILRNHEIVNDEVGGLPLLVTW